MSKTSLEFMRRVRERADMLVRRYRLSGVRERADTQVRRYR